MVDSLEREIVPRRHHHHHHRKSSNRNTFPSNPNNHQINGPVRHSYPANHKSPPEVANDENSEGYGTFRNKGPYIIDGDIGHVCHRRIDNEHEAMTEL